MNEWRNDRRQENAEISLEHVWEGMNESMFDFINWINTLNFILYNKPFNYIQMNNKKEFDQIQSMINKNITMDELQQAIALSLSLEETKDERRMLLDEENPIYGDDS